MLRGGRAEFRRPPVRFLIRRLVFKCPDPEFLVYAIRRG